MRAGFVTRLPAGDEKAGPPNQRQRFVNRFVGVAQRSGDMDLQFARACHRPAAQFTVGIPPAGSTYSSVALEQQVAAWLAEPDRFVTDKAVRHPSFDRHEYFSAAPYWSEDGQRFDGLVQDRRGPDDAQSGHFDRASMLRFVRKVYGLSLAGRLLGRRELFATAASLLRAWFLDPATRMNPTMRHAQVIPGKAEVNAVGIVEFREYCYLPYAIMLLAREGALGKAELQGIRSWFRQFIADCDRTGVISSALGRRNNIGTWAVGILGTMALFVHEFENPYLLIRMSSLRLGQQLGALSLQPHETERTRPLHYSLFNLSAWWSVTRLGKEFSIDLDRYSGTAGESLLQAVSMCGDNRHRFCDYRENEAAFDTWIGLLQQLFARTENGEPIHVVDNLYWGLPPVILTQQI